MRLLVAMAEDANWSLDTLVDPKDVAQQHNLGIAYREVSDFETYLIRLGFLDSDHATLGGIGLTQRGLDAAYAESNKPDDGRGGTGSSEMATIATSSAVAAAPSVSEERHVAMTADPKKVFIIHGRNVAAKNAVEQFVRSLKLEPIDFDELAADLGASFVGDIVREGMDRAQGIIALFTADEIASLRSEYHQDHDSDEDKGRWQSRPNVIFEAGMAYGNAPERTILAVLGGETKLFSDVKGIHLTFLGNGQDARRRFRQKLIGARCDVDLRSDVWLDPARSGDFDACLLPATSTPLRPTRALSDAGALLKLEAWVKKLPDDRYDEAISTDQIDKDCGLVAGTAERLITQAVAHAGREYQIRGPIDGIVVFGYEIQISTTGGTSRDERYRRRGF